MPTDRLIVGMLVLAGAVVAGGDPAGGAPPRYTIIDLGTLGGWSSVALGINDLGQIVGSADTPAGLRHAYLWENGVMSDLGTLPGHPQSEAWDINNLGEAVGISVPGAEHAVLWREGQIIPLGRLGQGGSTSASAINDASQVVGGSDLSAFERHPFLWENGVLTDLTKTFDIPGGTAWDINESGDIIVAPWLLHADGTVTTLGTLGGEITQGFGLNDSQVVAGWSERVPSQRIFYAFVWEEGEMLDLDAIGGIRARRAWEVNNTGQVVGSPSFLYDPDTGMHNLEELMPPDSGWSELSPRDINDAGWIVGSGPGPNGLHAFLMKPSPPGRCCFDGAVDPRCVDDVDEGECNALPGPQFFTPGASCTGDPDECPRDCNANGIDDGEDIADHTSRDCNLNEIPDECDIDEGTSLDCNQNAIPDECDVDEGTGRDCNQNEIPDECDIDEGTSLDCNLNLVPDECDVDEGTGRDCNQNAIPDECDIDEGTSRDCNLNLVPDECEPDCNGNDVADDCEIDGDGDGVIDACDGCPSDVNKTSPGPCGCNSAPGEEDDADADGFANCIDTCPGVDDAVFGPCEADEIPTMSAWGLVVMTLMLLAGGKVYFRRRSQARRRVAHLFRTGGPSL